MTLLYRMTLQIIISTAIIREIDAAGVCLLLAVKTLMKYPIPKMLKHPGKKRSELLA